jgi:hypothetical protein
MGPGNFIDLRCAAARALVLQDAARGIAALSKEAGLEVDEEEYLGSFRRHAPVCHVL